MEVKDSIIQKTIELFATKGYAKTSIQKIADECKTSQTNVLYHFKTKKKLFEACLEFSLLNSRNILFKNLKEASSDYERLKTLLDMSIHWAKEYPDQASLFLLLFYFSSYDKSFNELKKHYVKRGLDILYEYLENLNLVEGVSLEEFAHFIQKYVHGVMFNMICSDEQDILYKNYLSSLENLILSKIES
ncbi:MAG: TetR/AcrR family transcriptional regulator [Bacteriovoracaceae bacterium]|jgi:AcrR family transcriptional regulator|nr:TetR/AcrR family transcriptional regulator [Bacteriovoracaceae bacterium]